MNVPSKFKILGVTYTVSVIDPDKWADPTCVGTFDPMTNSIMALKQAPDVTFHTAWHEICHAMLHAMGMDKLYRDEKFVDLLGGMIAQVIATSECGCAVKARKASRSVVKRKKARRKGNDCGTW